MSRTAWLAARLAGYLWGWQTLLDSGCVCECVGGWEGVCVFVWHHSVPTPGLCTWPVVRVLPPAFSLPRKEQPRRQPAPPRSKRASRAERGPRPNAKSTEEPSVSASHSSVSASLPSEVPSSQWETQCTIVLAVSIFFSKRKVSPPEPPFLELRCPLTTSWHALSPPFFLPPWLWSCNDVAGWPQSPAPMAFTSIACRRPSRRAEWPYVIVFPSYTEYSVPLSKSEKAVILA